MKRALPLISIFFLTTIFCHVSIASGQTYTVLVKAVDENGNPLNDVIITTWPIDNSAISGSNGDFTLTIKDNAQDIYLYGSKEGYFNGCLKVSNIAKSLVLVKIPDFENTISPYIFGSSYWKPFSQDWDYYLDDLKRAELNMIHLGGIGFDGVSRRWDEYAFDKLIDVCRKLDATPLMQVQLHKGSLEGAVKLIQYAKIQHYNIQYYTIGNEPDGYDYHGRGPYSADDYVRDFRRYYHAIKNEQPDAIIAGPEITTGFNLKDHEWIRTVLEGCGDIIDVFTIHRYPYDGSQSINDSLSDSSYFDKHIADLREMMVEITGREIPIGVTEANLSWVYEGEGGDGYGDSIYAGIWWADSLGRMIKNKLLIVSFWSTIGDDPLSYFVPSDYSKYFIPGEIRPTFHVQTLFKNFGGEYINSTTSDAGITAYTCKRSDKSVSILLVNRYVHKEKSIKIIFGSGTKTFVSIPELSVVRIDFDQNKIITRILKYGQKEYDLSTGPQEAIEVLTDSVTSDDGVIFVEDSIQLTDYQISNKNFVSNKKNKIKSKFKYLNQSGSLQGGQIQVTRTEYPSEKSKKSKITLSKKKFSNLLGKSKVKELIDIGKAKQIILSARLQTVDRHSSLSKSILLNARDAVPLYDDFDGHGNLSTDGNYQVINGEVSPKLWTLWNAKAEIEKIGSLGNSLKLSIPNGKRDGCFADLSNPYTQNADKIKSFSADVFLSSKSTASNFSSGINIGGMIKDDKVEEWFGVNLNIGHGPWGTAINWGLDDHTGRDYLVGSTAKVASLDKWYNLKIDFIVENKKSILCRFYVDNIIFDSFKITDVKKVLENKELPYRPRRNLSVWKEKSNGDAIAYFDNVEAVYDLKNEASGIDYTERK